MIVMIRILRLTVLRIGRSEKSSDIPRRIRCIYLSKLIDGSVSHAKCVADSPGIATSPRIVILLRH